MGGQFGVEATCQLLDFGFVLAGSVKAAGADGKYDLTDLGQVIPLFAAASQDFKNVSNVPKEIAEMDEEDAGKVIAFAQVKLPGVVDKASLVLKINEGLKLGLQLVKFLSVLKQEDYVAVA